MIDLSKVLGVILPWYDGVFDEQVDAQILDERFHSHLDSIADAIPLAQRRAGCQVSEKN